MDDTRRLVKKAARNLYRVLEDPEFWTPEFCRAFFDWCEEQAYESPRTVLVRGQLAVELAGKTGDRHTVTKAQAVLASAYRRDAIARAEIEMQTALVMAGSCPCCLPEIYRRLGGIRLFQLHFAQAKDCLDKAIAAYRELGDDDGIGRTLIARGVAWWKLGEVDAALEDERRALQLLADTTPEFFYRGGLTNQAAFLATGDERHFVQAEPYLNGLRDRLAGIRGITSVRIMLSWIHGLVLARLGERQRALQMLRKTRLRLLRKRHDAEVIAITADIAGLYCETGKFRLIVDLASDTLSCLGDVSGTRSLLKHILKAAERELDETYRRLTELRRVVTVSIPPLTARPTLASVVAP
jgi:tetratricopeptide (TPR) repeat protein